MSDTTEYDVCIIGGGMAGMWLLLRLRQSGYSAILLEKDALGCGQSIRSQGIIHGGTKYALTGSLSSAADAITDMPSIWRACLAGEGIIDLSGAGILSEYHYLWSTGKLGSRMAAFFASKAVRGKVDPVEGDDLPAAFRDERFKGALYRLNEIVLDIPSVFRTMAAQVPGCALRADCNLGIFQRGEGGNIGELRLAEGPVIRARRYVFTAGEGNEQLMALTRHNEPRMQVRPLHMVMVRHRHPYPIYAHCLGGGSKPRVTITSHPLPDGSWVWYAGGDLAETGVDREPDEQIRYAKKELAKVLPWIDLSTADWETFRINRAEPAQSAKARPDTAFTKAADNVIVAWPTKLALSPNLADDVLTLLDEGGITPRVPQPEPPSGLEVAPVATTAWEEAFS